ncbi:MAG: hypothetical protein HY088_04920 [Ignavibacteriales bacterium]|nr:hypothetical protein [Ignavibacteriales bacterium]
MTFLLDLIGSTLIRSAIILIILSMTVTLNSALYDKTAAANTRANLEISANIMYQDIKQAGYNVSSPALDSAKARSVQFRADLDNKGGSDVIRYYGIYTIDTVWYNGAQAVVDTTWKIRRVINGGTEFSIAKNLRSFSFQYFDANGNYTTTLSSIKAMRIELNARIGATAAGTVTSTTLSNSTATKEFRVYPVNL